MKKIKKSDKSYKKLKSMKETKKKRFSKTGLMTIFIAAIMILSVMGFLYMGGDAQPENSYNGHRFMMNNQNLWATQINGVTFTFTYLPQNLENLTLDPEAVDLIQMSSVIGFTFDPTDVNLETIDLIRFDLANVFPRFNKYMPPGMTNYDNVAYNLPIVTCDNSTQESPVLYVRTSNRTGLFYDDNTTCINFEGAWHRDMLAVKDKIVYEILGII